MRNKDWRTVRPTERGWNKAVVSHSCNVKKCSALIVDVDWELQCRELQMRGDANTVEPSMRTSLRLGKSWRRGRDLSKRADVSYVSI